MEEPKNFLYSLRKFISDKIGQNENQNHWSELIKKKMFLEQVIIKRIDWVWKLCPTLQNSFVLRTGLDVISKF